MWCENCEMAVETDFSTHTEWTDYHEHQYGPFVDDGEYRGEYDPRRAGEVVEQGETRFQIGVRIDNCRNCAVFVDMRTFGRLVSDRDEGGERA